MNTNAPVIIYDGTCILCDKAIQFILKRDTKRIFLFTTLQGEYIQNLPLPHVESRPDSIILYYQGEVSYASTAGLTICTLLGYPYKAAAILQVLPKAVRDVIYHWIAKNRYTWFGKKSSVCTWLQPSDQDRFLP